MSGQTTAPTINGKPWYTSKTLWFNLICTALFAAEVNFKVLEGLIPGAVYSALAFVLPVGNMILRFITTTALIVPKVDQPAPPVSPSQGGFISMAWLPALKWLAAAALVAWCGLQIYNMGRDVNENKWLKKEAAQQQADQAERDRGAVLARAAAEFAIAEEARAAQQQIHLEGVIKNARKQFSLLARSSVLASGAGAPGLAGACAAGGVRHGADAQPKPEQGAAPPQIALVPWPVPVDPDLTLGAVWLWNAALTGQAAAPAGACRVDESTGQADPACADSSGLNLDDAWDNHTANARACAEDRARHQRLIDFLNAAERK